MKLLLLAAVFGLSACQAGPTKTQMESLTAQLQDEFPDQVAAISFENAPPLDPATIFIDMAPGVSPAEELAWLCGPLRSRVDAIDPRIEVTTTYGYYLRTDCR